ncbi:nitroreductase family protein [Anaerocolumna sp. AGMB13025]|uniref:nitroreductase family protein n=1 Tax=Anaerocolumna sp. AGMB13025 TaxID=3039116 RepID=UPI00241F8595|nr:nitroreductase family protein [Anaerocolumna sp. AGMB13025]WFR56611.1 nitroreductase family protein [Anaerocolumna sp. AGMB13025]
MDFYEAVKSRRTVRDFKEEPVDMEVIKRILSAGLKAPSNDHLRNWEFVILNDKSEIEKVLKKIPKKVTEKRLEFIVNSMGLKNECQQKMYQDAIPKQYSMLHNAGCLVLPFYRQKAPLLAPKTLSSLNGFASIWCCIENIFLAAAAEGLACSMRIPMTGETEYLAEVMGCPTDYFMPCFLSIGYPAEEAAVIEQKEVKIEDKIHINKW